MKILLIVPSYNEEKSIESVIKDIRDNFSQGDIIVVNDGSIDNTSRIAKALGVVVIDLPYNLGIGAAMQTGFLYALKNNYDVAMQFDGDGQHVAEEIPKILKPHTRNGTDIVLGSRFLSESGFTSSIQRKIGSRILSFIVSSLVGKRVTDTTSGFRVYGIRAIERFSLIYPEDYPEVETLVIAHKMGLSIEEVPSRIIPRMFGKSSITTMEAGYYMIKVVLAIFVDLLKKFD